MALIYFVILICSFSSVLCGSCICPSNPYDYIHFLTGSVILLMLIIIICLCTVVYKHKKGFTITKTITVNDRPKIDSSTQTVDENVMTEPAISKSMQDNKIPLHVRKPLGPSIPVFQKKQMDDIIKEVLNRQQKSESGSFRDLIALTKRKSSEGVNWILRRKSMSVKKHENQTNDSNMYENSHKIKNTENELTSSKDEMNIEHTTNMDEECDEIYDVLPKPVVVTIDEVYDTVPNTKLKGDDELYDTSQKPLLESNIVKNSLLPHSALETSEACNPLNSIVVSNDGDENDKLSITKFDMNSDNETKDHTTVPIYDVLPSGSKETSIQTIVDSDTDYTLLIADEERQKLTRYVNANNIKS